VLVLEEPTRGLSLDLIASYVKAIEWHRQHAGLSLVIVGSMETLLLEKLKRAANTWFLDFDAGTLQMRKESAA
jgi:ABC-type branched-subunit amino acid transport system ATPase component